VEKSSREICATFVFFKQQPKVNNRPMGENSPNPVTLIRAEPHFWVSKQEMA
jgi:hypothetical protein